VSAKRNLDDCPYCIVPFEIEAVEFGFFKACRAVFICRNCGLTRAESRNPSIAKRIRGYLTRKGPKSPPDLMP
jgi:hypothetical protein